MLDKGCGIEEQLRQWQAERARKSSEGMRAAPLIRDRRTVRINGREVEIVRKPRRSA